jgi:7,8-dihydropterin-6-yl-methyl-4-(beta-D-ribofuranosyl)aminobenzene 5'-phosphate synthase
MSSEIKITVLVENSVNVRSLRAEHGLAFHIQAGRRQLLFDTGQSDLLMQNARELQIDLRRVEAVVLSHGHYDHTGGLKAVRELAPQARLYLHPAALAPKFSGQAGGATRAIGMSEENAKAVREAGQSVVWSHSPTEVAAGIFVTGEIPRQNDFEDPGGRFFLDETGSKADPLVDDQALFFDTREGFVVVLGCGHAGVVNTVEHVRRLAGNRPVRSVIGGLHLLNASPERVDKTVEAFRRWDLRQIVPGHCTGLAAVARLWAAFPGRCGSCATGTKLIFE